jgi:hypothetical protein
VWIIALKILFLLFFFLIFFTFHLKVIIAPQDNVMVVNPLSDKVRISRAELGFARPKSDAIKKDKFN